MPCTDGVPVATSGLEQGDMAAWLGLVVAAALLCVLNL